MKLPFKIKSAKGSDSGENNSSINPSLRSSAAVNQGSNV